MKKKLNLEVSLLEIIISIVIFTICSVIVINSFIIARYTQIKSNDKTIGLIKVQAILEYIKSLNDLDGLYDYLNDEFDGALSNNIFINYYDKDWNISKKSECEYMIKVKIDSIVRRSGELIDIEVSAEKMEPYPFIDKKNEGNRIITLLSTSKFFYNLELGG